MSLMISLIFWASTSASPLRPAASASGVIFVGDEEVLTVLRQARRAPEPPGRESVAYTRGILRFGRKRWHRLSCDRTGPEGEYAMEHRNDAPAAGFLVFLLVAVRAHRLGARGDKCVRMEAHARTMHAASMRGGFDENTRQIPFKCLTSRPFSPFVTKLGGTRRFL